MGSATLIDTSVVGRDSISEDELTKPLIIDHTSVKLRAYVVSQLITSGGGRYVTFRLNGASYQGCDLFCNQTCEGRQVRIEVQPTLRISRSVGVSSTSDLELMHLIAYQDPFQLSFCF